MLKVLLRISGSYIRSVWHLQLFSRGGRKSRWRI